MKDLEQFSENMLEKMAVGDIHPTVLEQAALARIALAAKQAKPACFIGKQMLSDLAEENRSCGRVWLGSVDELDGNDRIPLYTTPQPDHTEQVNSPMQPLHIDEFGTIRFKANAIVQHLLDVAKHVGVNMNTIAMQGFKPEDEMQFAQLIGYSLSGYGELSYVTDESYERASCAAPNPE